MIQTLVVSALMFGTAVQQGGQQGRLGEQYDGSAAVIERKLGSYLNGTPIKNLMTPGEYSEWKIDLKAGQVVIAEASSEAFDPALEVVDSKEKVLKSNDDRYPGDQRPLLFWRCEADGTYAIRARCFANKFGGQFTFRSNVYKSVALIDDKPADMETERDEYFLARIPMKAGQLKQVAWDVPQGYFGISTHQAISPTGLPDIELPGPITPVVGASILASVDGDYYVLCRVGGNRAGKVRLRTVTHPIVPMDVSGSLRSGTAEHNHPTVWSLQAKAGEFLEIATPDTSLSNVFILDERPDISKYDLKDEKKNPFFPKTAETREPDKGPAFVELPGRARDPRRRVFLIRRDCELWMATHGHGAEGKYTATVKPAASTFPASTANSGALRIGNYDYWEFDAKSGDVMTFKARVQGFAQEVIVRDPDLAEVWRATAGVDQDSFDWNMIVRKPGRYLVQVSALGDGAAGTYTLNREVYAARTFTKGEPAAGNFSTGEAEVWKFTAHPNEPLLIRWTSGNSNYTVSVRDENGNNLNLPLTAVDDKNSFGILKVDRDRTYVIVLLARGQGGEYRIELGEIPGLAKTGN